MTEQKNISLNDSLVWVDNALSAQYIDREYAAMSRLSVQTKTALKEPVLINI